MKLENVDDELQEMKQKLEELKLKLTEALKVDEEFQQKVKTNPDIIRLEAEQRELTAQHLEVMEARETVIKNVNSLFTTDGRYPTFAHKSTKYPQYTNIKQEVLDAIVKDVGKLYMFRNEDIITLVSNMIYIEIEKYPELTTLEKKQDEIVLQRSKKEKEIYILRNTITQGWENTSYDLKSAIQQLERNIKDYSKDESIAKREDKIKQVRDKALTQATAEAINKKLRSEQ